ncbi:MAG: tetratricopeptide repeat protein [Alphaproteobacteria bacterium]|nr:tetratricopeptide repeat protein [Alphaproteobacteria bacterium]
MDADIQNAYSLMRRGNLLAAERICRSLLANSGNNANAHVILGMVEASRGLLESAASHFEIAAKVQKDRSDIHFNLGLVRLRQQQIGPAIASFDRALAIDPANNDAAFARADALVQDNRFDEAVAAFDELIQCNHSNPKIWQRRGFALYSDGRPQQAVESYARAVQLSPRDPDALNGMATALMADSKVADAVTALSTAIGIDRNFAAAFSNRAVAYTKLQQFEHAEADHAHAIRLDASDPRILANFAEFLLRLGRTDEAASVIRDLERVDPVAGAVLLGNAMAEQLRNDEARVCFDRALSMSPGEPFAHWCRSLLNLRVGNLREGFQEFEWRSKGAVSKARRDIAGAQWRPSKPARGESVLLYAEQGLGDSIQFARFVPKVIESGCEVVLEVPGPLVVLFRSLHPSVTVVETVQPNRSFDAHCALPSLPAKFGTTLDTIPSKVPYLRPVRPISTAIRERLGHLKHRRVGLCWSGNALHERDAKRSIPLSILRPIVTAHDVSFVSLQKDVRQADQAKLEQLPQITDFSDILFDFDDSASLVANLDLVISVDTSVAHLAGAMGKPLFLLLPFVPDWRWMLGRNDSPWYPSAKLFRQDKPGGWEDVIERVRVALTQAIQP